MSKVTYIIKASEDALNEKTAAILVQVAKKDFITSAELREILEETMNAGSVNSNIGVLIKKGLIEKSGDGLIITGEAQDIISKAAAIYNADGKHIMDVDNYQKALAKFVPMAEAVNSMEWLEKMQGEPVIRQIGIREKKSLWQKIKGFFK